MQYVGAGFQEYPESTILQMIGRAGRPQFDTKANVVIMTTLQQKKKYEKMLGGTELIESNLHRHLTEHLNAEIALGTITDIAIALEWLRYTFLYIRVLKNPKHYNIPTNFTKNQIEKKLQDWCQIEINALHKHGMLQIDQTDGFSVMPTNTGILMANYYLAFNTMKIFTEIKGTETLSELLVLICKCQEFSESYLRMNDKKTLNLLNKNKCQETIRFPMKGTIRTTPMKIYCLIQATFGCIRIQNPALYQESIKIMRIGERIIKCLVTYLLNKNNYFSALLNTLILNQCFSAQLWENSPYVARQFPKIGTVLSSMLVSAGKTDFKTILDTSPRDIERIINRSPPMGNDIHELILHLPFYKLNLECCEMDKYKLKITITLLNAEDINKNCTAGLNNHMTLLVGDSENNILCCKKIFHRIMSTSKTYIEIINLKLKTDHNIKVYLISENWVGIDCKENYDIIVKNDDIIPKNINFPNTTKQKEITNFFSPTKKNTDVKNTKKQNKTIDKYFQNKKFVVPLKNITKENNIQNEIIPETEVSDLEISDCQNEQSNFENNLENFEHNFSNLKTQNLGLKNLKVKQPYYKMINKLPNIENHLQKLELVRPKTNMVHHADFQTFSQNLAQKFSQYSEPVSKSQNYENEPSNFETENIEQFEHDITFDSNSKNDSEFNNLEQYFQMYSKLPNMEDSRQKLELLPKTNMSQLSQIQNLAQKFSQNSEIISKSQNYELQNFDVKKNNRKYSQDSESTSNFDINKKVRRIENNIKIKTMLSQFQYTPNTIKNIKKPTPITFNKPKEPTFISSQIPVSQNYSQNTCSQSQTVTNEELEKFKRFIQSQNIERKNTAQNNSEVYPMQYCKAVYNDSKKVPEKEIEIIEINDSLDNDSIFEENNETLKSENKNNVLEKPYFPKQFKEYVQNSIDNLKQTTLVNEYFNYDIGFQEFLMGPLDNSESSDSDISVTERSLFKSPEKDSKVSKTQNFVTQNFESQDFEAQNFDLTFCGDDNENFMTENTPENYSLNIQTENDITFSCSGKIFSEKKLSSENFEPEFNSEILQPEFLAKSPEEEIQFEKIPEISDVNFTFSCSGNIFKNSQNLQDFENVSLSYSPEINTENYKHSPEIQNSESSEDLSEKITLKVENKMKIIEQFYSGPLFMKKDTQEDIRPVKRQKLSNPFTIQKRFNNPIKNNDPFKKMTALNDIMNKYGNHDKKITLNKNKNKEYVNEPKSVNETKRNEIVRKTAYSYSITIYEKDDEGNKSENEKRFNNYPSYSRY